MRTKLSNRMHHKLATRVLRGRKEVIFFSEKELYALQKGTTLTWSCQFQLLLWRMDGRNLFDWKILNDSQQYSRNLTQEIFLSVDSHVSDWRVTSSAVHLSFGLNAILLRRITCILSEGLELDSTCPTHLSTVWNVRPLLPANYFGDDLLSFSATQRLEWKQSAAGEGHYRGWAAAMCKDQWTEVATFAFLHTVEGTKSSRKHIRIAQKIISGIFHGAQSTEKRHSWIVSDQFGQFRTDGSHLSSSNHKWKQYSVRVIFSKNRKSHNNIRSSWSRVCMSSITPQQWITFRPSNLIQTASNHDPNRNS